MSIWQKLFPSAETANKVIDGTISGLDKLKFTDEEKADFNARYLEWYLSYLKATEGQNVSRRLIALIIVGTWSVVVILTFLIRLFSKDIAEFGLQMIATVINNPFMLIVGFYFVKQMVGGISLIKEPKK